MPPLRLVLGDDLEVLVDAWAKELRSPLESPLEPLWCIVPSAPVRQWIDWALARRLGTSSPHRDDGISANFVHLFPEEFVRAIEQLALADSTPPWRGWDPSTVSLTLARSDPTRTLEECRALARDVDLIARWRPEWINWPNDAVPSARRALAAYSQLGPLGSRPVEQRRRAIDALLHSGVNGLPTRISLVGLSTSPGGPAFVELVRTVAQRCDVSIYLCATDDLGPESALSEWTLEAREHLELWTAHGDVEITRIPSVDLGSTHLHRFQRALRRGEEQSGDLDHTVRVVGVPGDARQVEVARDLILDATQQTGATARDVLVLSSDLTRFSPSLERHWMHRAHAGRARLPVELTERPSSFAETALDGALALLELADRSITREQLEDVASIDAVRRVLGLSTDDWNRWWTLAGDTPVVLGTSVAQRRDLDIYGPDDQGAGTWESLLDELVSTFIDAEVESPGRLGVRDDVALAAQVAPLLSAINDAAVDVDLRPTRSLVEWLQLLSSVAETCRLTTLSDDSSLSRFVERASRDVNDCDAADLVVSLEEFLTWCEERRTSAVRQRVFGRFGATASRLTSMPRVPARIVCLLGVDQASFPEPAIADQLLGPRRVGDPDPRYAIRSALFSAICCARDRLIVMFTNRDLTSGRQIVPTVALEELLGPLARTADTTSPHLLETASRHAHLVIHDSPRTIDFTYDRLDANDPDRSVTTHPPESQTVSHHDARRFARSPARYYLTTHLGADVPDDEVEGDVVPPLRLDDRLRARMQRWYFTQMTASLTTEMRQNGVRQFDLEDHDPSMTCASRPCRWRHEPAAQWRDETLDRRRFRTGTDTRLWRHRLQFDLLDLAAYNHACDSLDDELVAAPIAPLNLGNGRTWELADARRGGALDGLISFGGDLALRRIDTRAQSGPVWRDLLADVVDLAALRAAGVSAPTIRRSRLPDRVEPYDKRRQGTVPRYRCQFNPITTLRYCASADDALDDLRWWFHQLEALRNGPVALFARTSVAVAAPTLRLNARALWSERFAESREFAHQLLYPYEFESLSALDDGQFPLQRDLARLLSHVEYASQSGTKRPPARALVRAFPTEYFDDDAEVSFAAIAESPPA